MNARFFFVLLFAIVVLAVCGVPVAPLVGPVFVLLLVVAGLIIMLGIKKPGEVLAPLALLFVAVLAVPAALSRWLSTPTGPVPGAAGNNVGGAIRDRFTAWILDVLPLVIVGFLVVGLVIFLVGTWIRRWNRRETRSLEEKLLQRAGQSERRRAAPYPTAFDDSRLGETGAVFDPFTDGGDRP